MVKRMQLFILLRTVLVSALWKAVTEKDSEEDSG